MTNIGTALLNEYVSEVNERIEDDKKKLRLKQGLSNVYSTWRLILLTLTQFFIAFWAIWVIVLMFIDVEMIDTVKSATSEEIVENIETLLTLASLAAIFAPALFFMRYFRDRKEERLLREQENANLMTTIVQINEELLLRHGLINSEDIINVKEDD